MRAHEETSKGRLRFAELTGKTPPTDPYPIYLEFEVGNPQLPRTPAEDSDRDSATLRPVRPVVSSLGPERVLLYANPADNTGVSDLGVNYRRIFDGTTFRYAPVLAGEIAFRSVGRPADL